MGWNSFEPKQGGKLSKEDIYSILKNEFEPYEIVDHAIVENADYYPNTDDPRYIMYAAIRRKDSKDISALIVLVNLRGSTFIYKDMDENLGPYYYTCPIRILDKLTRTDSTYAQKWREECRKRMEAFSKMTL